MTVLDELPDGVVLADGAGVVTGVNQVAATLLGVGQSESVGRNLVEVLTLRNQAGTSWVDFNRPYGGLNSRTGVPEQSWTLPDGSEVLVTARVSRNQPRGPITGIAIMLRSGRGRERLDRERSDLVATVAHELRSPLTGVKGFVQALLNRWDRLSDEQKRLMLTTVSSDADRLARLIAELLDVARIDTGRLTLSPRPTDLHVVVPRIVASVQQQSNSRVIEYHLPEELPKVMFDPDKFTQVLTNLVENAVRHGEGTVRVRGELAAAGTGGESGQVVVTVDDEGEGIDPEMRRRVFTKFWQHGARGGSGLGMYIVNGLVRAHGGQVLIDDAPGGGARVELRLPVGVDS